MARTKQSDDRAKRNAAASMYVAGFKVGDISERLGVSVTTVYKWIRETGVDKSQKHQNVASKVGGDWRVIEEYPNYMVNDRGEVLSVKSQKTLRAWKGINGYMFVDLCEDGVYRHRSVHRLVAKAFIPNPENLPVINHIDGDKTHNVVGNLEWVTESENIKHAYRTGLKSCYDPAIKRAAVRMWLTGKYNKIDIARRLKVSETSVCSWIRAYKEKTSIK